MPTTIVSKGFIEVWRDDVFVSRHTVETKAIESALEHAEVHGDGDYELRFPRKVLSKLTRTVVVDTTPPTAPSSLTATAAGQTTINLAWSAAFDANGVVRYDVLRGGSLVNFTNGVTLSYSDTSVAPGTAYSYTVRARDQAGNISADSNLATATTDPAYTAPFWTIPDLVGVDATLSATPGQVIPLTSYYSAGDGTPFFTVVSATNSQGQSVSVTIDSATGAITAPATADTYTLSVDLQDSAVASWASRSTAPGVIWAHDFSESNSELELFTRLDSQAPENATNTNPDPTTLRNPLTLVTTSLGASKSIRARMIGTSLTATAAGGTAGDVQVLQVSDATDIPDPATWGAYDLLIGQPGGMCWEYVRLTAKSGNALTVTRRTNSQSYPTSLNGVSYPYPQLAPFPAGWRIGLGTSGSWNRPLCAFPAGQNGKATADVGLLNGSARKARTWPTSRLSWAHRDFREGYFGSKWYWDTTTNPAAPYRNWTPLDPPGAIGGARADAFEGDEFYLQFRMKMTAARVTSEQTKLFFIQNAAVSGAGQLYIVGGGKYANEQPVASEAIPGVSYGGIPFIQCGGGDGRQPAGGKLWNTGQYGSNDAGPGNVPWFVDYPNGYYENRASSTCYSFCLPSETWITFLVRMKLGRDNAEAYHTAGANSTVYPGPVPASADASYRTIVEVKVALPGWTDYKTLVNVPDAIWYFSDDLGTAGYLYQNPPGLNTFWMTQNWNMYIGSGSVAPPPTTMDVEYTQAILSRNAIPVPT